VTECDPKILRWLLLFTSFILMLLLDSAFVERYA